MLYLNGLQKVGVRGPPAGTWHQSVPDNNVKTHTSGADSRKLVLEMTVIVLSLLFTLPGMQL